ncbi:MAG: DUF4292 domain-containing protein [Paludibacteraceae bacterium]|nr:DUF4292 domain-containing protein [Paludibacteraceae bacterium]
MQKIKHILIICILILGLASCATSSSTPRAKQSVTQRAQVTLSLDQHSFSMNCLLRVWKNELVVLSVLPVMGIEMLRLEATPDSILIIDKMNKKYAIVGYNELNDLTEKNISYKTLQYLAQRTNKEIEYEVTIGTHKIKIAGKFAQRERSKQKEAQRLNLNKYKQVTLRNILPI